MKKFLTSIAMLAAVVTMTGCATTYPRGVLYQQLTLPQGVTEKTLGTRVGKAECKSLFGLIATGDASITAAARNGNITNISHVDWEVENILGIIGTYRCVVYGD